MSTRGDESIPILQVAPGQIEQAKERAKALDLADIEARHGRVALMIRAGDTTTYREGMEAHADRAALLAALREERAARAAAVDEAARLRGAIEAGRTALRGDRHGAYGRLAEADSVLALRPAGGGDR